MRLLMVCDYASCVRVRNGKFALNLQGQKVEQESRPESLPYDPVLCDPQGGFVAFPAEGGRAVVAQPLVKVVDGAHQVANSAGPRWYVAGTRSGHPVGLNGNPSPPRTEGRATSHLASRKPKRRVRSWTDGLTVSQPPAGYK